MTNATFGLQAGERALKSCTVLESWASLGPYVVQRQHNLTHLPVRLSPFATETWGRGHPCFKLWIYTDKTCSIWELCLLPWKALFMALAVQAVRLIWNGLEFFIIIFHFKYVCQQGDDDKHMHCALLFVQHEKPLLHKTSGLKKQKAGSYTCLTFFLSACL